MSEPTRLFRVPTLSRSLVLERTWPFFLDLSVGACGLALFYAVLRIAQYWMGHPVPAIAISRSAKMLPLYAFYSIVRIGVAYLLSLTFAVGYGYIAAYTPRAEPFMIAALDILQSIPVLSFLPAVMLAMISLIPGRQLGIEMGAILLIFTGQVWNMAFSFYSSLKSLPRELREAAGVFRFSAWQRFWQLELPYSAIGMVWNGVRDVRPRRSRLPPARARLLPADCGQHGRQPCHALGVGDHDPDHRRHRSAGVAAGYRLGG
jgi:NitT/TauT family transport system permease protein